MRKLSFILCFFIACLFAAEPSRLEEVLILQTTDTHGRLTSLDGTPNWLQLATLIQRERAKAPEYCILIDTGDLVQGSMTATLSSGKAAFLPLEILGFDAWIPGNHEADFGPQAYRSFTRLGTGRLLCGNFRHREDAPAPAWKLFRRGRARIAVIGMQAVYFENWLLPAAYQCYVSERAVPVLKRILPAVCAAKPDAIILAMHQAWFEGPDKRGVNEVNEIARTFPEIDVILGAHSHRRIPGEKIGLHTWYMQAGCHCEFLGVLKLTVDTEQHEVVDIQSSLKGVLPDTPEDTQLSLALFPFTENTRRELERDTGIVLPAAIPADGKPGMGCATSELIAQAIAKAVNAEIALHGKLSEYSLPAGKLHTRQLFALVPYENTIITAEVTAYELEQIVLEQWKQRSSYRFAAPWNATFQVSPNAVRLLSISGKSPLPGRRYRLALNNHTAAGSGTCPVLRSILEKSSAHTTDTGILTRSAVEAFLRDQEGKSTTANWLLKN